MMYNAVIFDFDGTICNTGEGVLKSVKYALDYYGVEAPEWEELTQFIGPPLLVSFQEYYHQSVSDADKLVKKFRERYTNVGVYESKLYDGIEKLLINLKNDGIKIGIASSKPQTYIEILLDKFNVSKYFDSVCGTSFDADCESKQSIMSRCLKELGADAKQTVVVGDTYFDIEGAKANFMDTISVMWGFGSKFEFIEYGAKYIIEKPEDVESIVLGLYEVTDNVEGIFNGRVIKVHNDTVTLCNNDKANRECVDHPGGVAVIGLTDDDNVVLVRQFRYPYKETIYEIPAGKLEKGEEPLEAGKREFKEECGGVADEYVYLGDVYPTPGYTNEIIRLYYAKGLHFEEQNLDKDEFLEVCQLKFDTVVQKIMSNEIKDAKTIIAIFKLKELMGK